jgi:di/tricarboxylate transporter
MAVEQLTVFAILIGAVLLFLWGPWRYDIVALIALLAAVVAGVVPFADAFSGFGHPATVTVAAVLVLSRALSNSGAIDFVTRYVRRAAKNPTAHVGILSSFAAVLSTMMNNVAAAALMIPVAVESAVKAKRSPATVLMPLSFGSILGGLVTLIGTPPNIIVATYRGDVLGTPFGMFDFSPVGGAVALIGVAFVVLLGWHLIPKKRRQRLSSEDLFEIEDYVTEAKVPKGSAAVEKSVRELDEMTAEIDALIVGVIRGERRILGTARRERVRAGDVLIIESAPQEIDKFVKALGLTLVGIKGAKTKLLSSDEVAVAEAVVTARSRMEGRISADLRLRSRYGVNLLAVSRQGQPFRGRLRAFRFRAGDVLLLQGDADALPEVISTLGCLPLAERKLKVGQGHRAGLSVAIFAAAIACATAGLLSVQIALTVAAVAMVLLNIVPAREIYDSVDWPVIVLLGAMIPVAGALEATGATQAIAGAILNAAAGAPAIVVLVVVMVVTMTLSDVMNNAATTVVMAPIAVGIAYELGASPDSFLMAVAVGASCAFLTPVGHQNNTLIMGPGGYEFGDYWRMGLPLELIIVLIATPMIAWVWPL